MILKLATTEDFDSFYKLKSDESNIFWTGWNDKPDYDNLKIFFNNTTIDNVKEKKDRRIYIAFDNNIAIGYAYIDYVDENMFSLSIGIHSDFHGKGYGKELVKLSIQEGLKLGYKNMEAYIREDNIASQKCCEYNGVIKTDKYEIKYIPNLNKELKMVRYLYESK